MENSFKITGFVSFSEEKAFNNSSVCRFSISVSRKEKDSDNWTSAFLNAEAWVKNEEVGKFSTLQKGNRVTIEGFFKPEEWTDKDGKKHNRVTLVATKFYLTDNKETEEK